MATPLLLSQVLLVLCANESLWGPCCCSDPAKGTTFETLLTTLQTDYPASDFTEELLTTVLNTGRRKGLFKQIGSTSQWFIFTDFISVNPANAPYAAYCPGKICRPRQQNVPTNTTTTGW